MTLEELQEAIEDALELQDFSGNFNFIITKRGEIVIHTGLKQDDDDQLVDLKGDPEEDEDLEFAGSEDFEPIVDEDDPDDE